MFLVAEMLELWVSHEVSYKVNIQTKQPFEIFYVVVFLNYDDIQLIRIQSTVGLV